MQCIAQQTQLPKDRTGIDHSFIIEEEPGTYLYVSGKMAHKQLEEPSRRFSYMKYNEYIVNCLKCMI